MPVTRLTCPRPYAPPPEIDKRYAYSMLPARLSVPKVIRAVAPRYFGQAPGMLQPSLTIEAHWTRGVQPRLIGCRRLVADTGRNWRLPWVIGGYRGLVTRTSLGRKMDPHRDAGPYVNEKFVPFLTWNRCDVRESSLPYRGDHAGSTAWRDAPDRG